MWKGMGGAERGAVLTLLWWSVLPCRIFCCSINAAAAFEWCSPLLLLHVAGTGKTAFLFDMMYEYALHDHPILYHSWESPNTIFCFGPNGVRHGNREAFEDELLDPDAMWVQHCACTVCTVCTV